MKLGKQWVGSKTNFYAMTEQDKPLTREELLKLMKEGHEGLNKANQVFIKIYELLANFKE